MERWCRLKGISVVGTGDCLHGAYLKELKEKLKPAEEGLYRLTSDPKSPIRFMLTVEVSLIYRHLERTRKVHHVILAPDFAAADKLRKRLLKIGNLDSDGRPILGLGSRQLLEIILECDSRFTLIPAHAWTPWFSIFGSKSGYDSIEECFGDLSPRIFAIETGLSSDRPMNERLSMLDRVALVSNSDAHSPAKLGREANVLDCQLSFTSIVKTLRDNSPKTFLRTIEFFPEEGKYHYDGHLVCKVCLHPRDSKKNKLKCPNCGKALTLGVMHRIEALADRPWDYVSKGRVPQVSIIPLEEVIADAFDVGAASKRVREAYLKAVIEGGGEFEVLLDRSEKELLKLLPEKAAQGVMRMRQGDLKIAPGYDGEFGKISIFRDLAKFGRQAGARQLKAL